MAIDTSNNINNLTAAYLNASAVNAALTINTGVNNNAALNVNQGALQRATDLAADAAVVVSLSNANLLNQTQPLTYNAAGLLNTAVAINTATSVAQAIAAANDAAEVRAAEQAQQAQQAQQSQQADNGLETNLSTEQSSNLFYAGVLSGLATAPSTVGLYTTNGSFTGIDTAYATQLAQVLQANPDLADTISGEIAAQGVTGALLSVTA
ncbi:hypothetical protein [Herbaspirillum sp. alder98]|uniref:hypothetical protein n=1 Tax=Herbaspirillum sp. alder98 TaxID=2913096 RepID=UPI001CD8BD5C|nr:hypothetical protein [Herbaspirillum sp. alder98]MCA1327112.1 hypothetical protein [Herbaspirillum sp. alder98]